MTKRYFGVWQNKTGRETRLGQQDKDKRLVEGQDKMKIIHYNNTYVFISSWVRNEKCGGGITLNYSIMIGASSR